MITLALAISTVALGGVAMYLWWDRDGHKRDSEYFERSAYDISVDRRKWVTRYHAALRALRTRQAVIDGLGKERTYWERVFFEETASSQRAHAEALFYQTQAEEAAKQRDEWKADAEKAEDHMGLALRRADLAIQRADRLAAQLKKLKARKA